MPEGAWDFPQVTRLRPPKPALIAQAGGALPCTLSVAGKLVFQ